MGSLSTFTNPWRETPLVESTTLSRAAGCRVFLKLENLQPSSSFKSRGIGNLMLSHILEARMSPDANDRPLHFYSSSGGNAGLACVTAATTLGYKSTVVVPTSTEESMIIKLRAAGADDVVSFGDSWAFADEHLREVVIPRAEANGEKGIYIPPFNHPIIWDGASTLVDEIQRQMPGGQRPDGIVCSVGGGGLFAGVMRGLDRVGREWSDHVQVLAVETVGADSLAQSVQANHLVTLPGITSIAKSLGAVKVADHAFRQALRPTVSTVVLEDAEAAMGSWRFADDERMLVEPACGVSCALVYDDRLKSLVKNFSPESKIVIIVCGGSRVSLRDLEEWKAEFGKRAEDLGREWLAKSPFQSKSTLLNEKREEVVPSGVTA